MFSTGSIGGLVLARASLLAFLFPDPEHERRRGFQMFFWFKGQHARATAHRHCRSLTTHVARSSGSQKEIIYRSRADARALDPEKENQQRRSCEHQAASGSVGNIEAAVPIWVSAAVPLLPNACRDGPVKISRSLARSSKGARTTYDGRTTNNELRVPRGPS
jgi:hypothetical protein